MKTAWTYVFMFVPIPEGWVAHASRVLAMASSRSRISLDSRGFQALTNPKDSFGGTPLQRMRSNGQAFQTARETRALPNDLLWTWVR
jgi:hypothetical protein